MRVAILAMTIILSACSDARPEMFQPRDAALDVVGEIDSDTPDLLEEALSRSPEITMLRLVPVPGSSDDETSLQALLPLIRKTGLATVVPFDGIAEAFYWFTLAAVGPDEMHWMSEDEINRFGLSMTPVAGSPVETPDQRAARCGQRLP